VCTGTLLVESKNFVTFENKFFKLIKFLKGEIVAWGNIYILIASLVNI